MNYNPVICALDVSGEREAIALVQQVREHVGAFKIGLELLSAVGPGIMHALRTAGADRIFYDAKLHDIPNTVGRSMSRIAEQGAWAVTVHSMGGHAMLAQAVSAARDARGASSERTLVFAVTVLTSLSATALRDTLMTQTPIGDFVMHLARIAYEAGCDGVVASPHEVGAIRAAVPNKEFIIVTPGVRPVGSDRGDQQRVTTPVEAMRRGATHIVIGRPITAADDPGTAARAIFDSLGGSSES